MVRVWVLCSSIFISVFLKTGGDPAYTDDSYYVTTGVTKDIALAEMQEKIRKAEKWMSGSGLRVNLKKTEIFHRMDTSNGSITVGGNVISSTSKMNVLGIVFDNCLQWDKHIDKTILDTRRAVQALRTILRYFSKDELLKLCTSLCFSKLYYASEVWLIPDLKESLFKKLYSQSGKCLKVVDLTKSYQELHVSYHRATPKLFALYQTSLYYYTMMQKKHYCFLIIAICYMRK